MYHDLTISHGKTSGCFQFGAIIDKAANICVWIFRWIEVFILWNKCPGLQLLSWTVVACLPFRYTAKLFPRVAVPFCIPPAMYEGSSFSAFSTTVALSLCFVLYFSHSDRCELTSMCELRCGFNLHFCNGHLCRTSHSVFICHLYILWWNRSLSFAHFLTGSFDYWLLTVEFFLYSGY